jgi:hypothetical protein
MFFYLTEDYIQEQTKLKEKIDPILEDFGRNLLSKGAVVKAFDKDIHKVNQEVMDKWTQQEDLKKVVFYGDENQTPGLLMINVDFQIFNPHKHQWLYVSFRDYMNEFGEIKIFEIQSLLANLAKICNSNQDLFKEAKSHIRGSEALEAHKILEIKPGMFGISLDLKEAIKFIKNWNNKYKE